MKTNSKAQGKKQYSLLFAITMVVGSVIGTGIFFKNQSIIPWSQGNAILTIGAWALGGLIALTTALAFSQVARKAKRRSNAGVGEFAEEIISVKFGWHTKLNWALFYFPWNYLLVSLYTADYIVRLATGDPSSHHTMLTIEIGIGLIVFFLILNILAKRVCELIQINTTFVKLLPIIVTSIGAIITIFMLRGGNWWTDSSHNPYNSDSDFINKKHQTDGYNIPSLIFFLVPGTLFAYDSFLNVTNVSENTKREYVTYAIVGGMILIATVYILVTVAILNTGTLDVESALIKMFGGDPQHLSTWSNVLKKIVQICIVISTLGVTSGFALSWVKNTEAVLKEPTSKRVAISTFSTILIVGGPLLLVTLIIYFCQKDGNQVGISVVDGMSNPLIIISYSIYAVVVLVSIIKNLKQRDITKKYARWYTGVSIISAVGIFAVLGYTIFYVMIYKIIAHPNDVLAGVPGYIYLVIVVSYILFYIFLPFAGIRIKNFYLSSDDFKKIDRNSN